MEQSSHNQPGSDDPEEVSPVARGVAWYSHAMTISMEMVVPGAVGIWLDRQFGTGHVCALVGFLLGITVSLWHLFRLTLVRQEDMPGRGTRPDSAKPSPKPKPPKS